MSPRTGRPAKEASEKKSVRLEIRMTEEEHERLLTLSEQYCLSKTDTINKALELLARKKK